MYNMIKSPNVSQCGPSIGSCGFRGVSEKPFRVNSKRLYTNDDDDDRRVLAKDLRKEECAAALVFFRTRYAALVAAHTLQSPNPMLWVTYMALEPPQVFWTNLCVQYRLLWVCKIETHLAAIVLMIFFFVPVSIMQNLVHLEKLKENFTFVRRLSNKRNFIFDMVTGYLPSVMLMLFLYSVPPVMSTLAAVEGWSSCTGGYMKI